LDDHTALLLDHDDISYLQDLISDNPTTYTSSVADVCLDSYTSFAFATVPVPDEPGKDISLISSNPTSDFSTDDAISIIKKIDSLKIVDDKRREELKKIQAMPSHLCAGCYFTDPRLKIPEKIVEAIIYDLRFEKPSAIQAGTIPRIIDGADLIAQAQSGAGKSIAFCVGMLAKIQVMDQSVQALCLTPTRELAQQIISDAIVPLSGRMSGVTSQVAVPGVENPGGPMGRRDCCCHIIVGTPGTVSTWIRRLEILVRLNL